MEDTATIPSRQSPVVVNGTALDAPPIIIDAIPQELRKLPQWVCWKYETRVKNDGTTDDTKVPIDAHHGSKAKANDPATWCTFAEAVAAKERYGCDGIGFMFSDDDPFTGVDLDACRDPVTGFITPWAAKISQGQQLPEVSPSGTGVKIIFRAEKNPTVRGALRN